jgi:2'-5' RNA ligase
MATVHNPPHNSPRNPPHDPDAWPRRVRLGDHTAWRPDWTSCRPVLWWYLTFDHLPAVAEHASRAAARLRPLPHVDVPPTEWLHLTMCEVGFRHQLDSTDLDEGIAAAREALRGTAPVDLRLGPVNSLDDAVVLEARPLDELRGLRATVRGAMAEAGIDRVQRDEDQFWPHVTIGYLNAAADHQALMDEVGSHARVVAGSTVPVTADRLELVEVTRADRHYRWRTIASVELGRQLAGRH